MCNKLSVSVTSVQPFPRTVVWYFVMDEKKQKKTEINICKTYMHPPHWRLRKSSYVSFIAGANRKLQNIGSCGFAILVVVKITNLTYGSNSDTAAAMLKMN